MHWRASETRLKASCRGLHLSESLTNTDVLNSWKEVAVYMGRGVRTVQRWERELGLPVRRPRGRSRSAVIAFKPELDRWLAQAPTDTEELRHPAPVTLRLPSVQVSQHTTSLTTRNHQLLARSHDLRQRTMELCIQLNRNLEVAHHLVDRAFPTSKSFMVKCG
jgi:hypothetical protein